MDKPAEYDTAVLLARYSAVASDCRPRGEALADYWSEIFAQTLPGGRFEEMPAQRAEIVQGLVEAAREQGGGLGYAG